MLIAFGVTILFAVIIGYVTSLTTSGDGANWFGPLIIMLTYLIVLYAISYYYKLKSNYSLRMSQFLLAVLCRVENNRLYLNHGIEVRPGFNAEWIEFCVLPNPDASAYI